MYRIKEIFVELKEWGNIKILKKSYYFLIYYEIIYFFKYYN